MGILVMYFDSIKELVEEVKGCESKEEKIEKMNEISDIIEEVLLDLEKFYKFISMGDSGLGSDFKKKVLEKLKAEKGDGRKEELFRILESGERYSIRELGEKMGISDKNISSLLSYLRKGGVKIVTDWEGKKYIEK